MVNQPIEAKYQECTFFGVMYIPYYRKLTLKEINANFENSR